MPSEAFERVYQDLIDLEAKYGSVITRTIAAKLIVNFKYIKWRKLKDSLLTEALDELNKSKIKRE